MVRSTGNLSSVCVISQWACVCAYHGRLPQQCSVSHVIRTQLKPKQVVLSRCNSVLASAIFTFFSTINIFFFYFFFF